MTIRLIEKCFIIEKVEEEDIKYPLWIIDLSLVELDDLKQDLSIPGKLIRIKSADAITINYGSFNYANY